MRKSSDSSDRRSVRVAVRIRPLLKEEKQQQQGQDISCVRIVETKGSETPRVIYMKDPRFPGEELRFEYVLQNYKM